MRRLPQAVIVLCRAGALVAEPCVALFDPSRKIRMASGYAHQPDPGGCGNGDASCGVLVPLLSAAV